MRKLLPFLITLIFLCNCNSKVVNDPELEDFVQILTGKFSSKKQAKEESGYAAVCLINSPIWKDQSGYWFYQELFNEEKSTAIYNQRIINIKRVDSITISSSSYIIPNQKKYINGWKDTSLFNQLTIDSLTVRAGCDVYFKKKTSTIYQGKTSKNSCSSSFSKKIKYTTSNIVMSRNKISSWDRGYDSEGKQVWGKIEGPYDFIRVIEN
ncbi:chromophore lyase CpcT/CpeT [uncultured Aquimarina sp.]|uniref:chromophore lyase CpcT/CpeT n=1 Tax=uncultured Aquimarina sp. TaxID=575652 RepID=UPI00261627EA|nr:chromophore lyase CpcT/CpeT [uncultured Aquimarina sp.]